MSRKSESNLRTKFSSLFSGGPRGAVSTRSPPEEFNLDTNTLNELGKGNLQNRLKLLQHLVEKVEEKRLEKNGIKSLWVAIQDIAKEGPIEARHTVIGFLCALVSSHPEELGSMRQTLFQYIKSCHPDDLEPCFNLLISLTLNGSNLHLLEEHISSYIEKKLLPYMVARSKTIEVLKFLADVTKTNATYIDEQLLGAVFEKCYSPASKQPIEEIQECLNYIETVAQYAIVPPICIHSMILYICQVRCIVPKDISPGVSHPASQSLKSLMRMLVFIPSLEHTIIFTMCSFLEEAPIRASFVAPNETQISTMFLLSTTLWNKERKFPRQHHCDAILASVNKAIQTRQEGIVLEVLKSFEFYVRNHGEVMEHLTWDAMLSILEEIVNQQKEEAFQNKQVLEALNSMLSEAEETYSERGYFKCKDRFYEIIEMCVDVRPIDSLNNLMAKKERLIVPGVLQWSDNLVNFMSNFYSTTRPERIRRNALEKCWEVVDQFYDLYEEELLEIVLRVLQSVHSDPNPSVRHRAVQFLVGLCYRCFSRHFYSIINIILKVVSVVVQQNDENESILICEELINLFLHKVSRTPSTQALFMFEGLIKLATGFYSANFEPHFQYTSKIRFKILECLWRISMSRNGETLVYLPQEGAAKRTVTCPFIKIAVSDSCIRPQELSPHKLELEVPSEEIDMYSIVNLPYDHVDHLIYHCLNKEDDWNVLQLTLSAIKKRLCNAQFQTRCNLDSLTHQLVELLGKDSQKRLEDLRNTPKDFSLSDVKACIFPVLLRLIPYQADIYKTSHVSAMSRKLLKAFHGGLQPKTARICIEGLNLAIIEMTSLIKPKDLAGIIRDLARIAVSRNLAIATLSFLSFVALIPALYKDFTEEEYKVVISVILPYTDPVKFDVYVIHFAHVVVCNWYVRCHYKHRPAFKEYILSQLRSTVKSVDRQSRGSSLLKNELSRHSEKRKISTESKDSKTHQGLRPRSGDYGRLSGPGTPRTSLRAAPSTESMSKTPDPERLSAHVQLIDVTEDLLERWMYSGRCNVIKKSPQLDLLFANKKTKTWVVGNTLVTISTSLSCEKSSSTSCQRCKMVQALIGEVSFGSDESQEFGGPNFKIPIPGASPASNGTKDFNKIITPKCGCWCKDFAHLEIRSPTSNSSIILRLQNKCQFIGLDSATGGDSHLVTSLFDDDLSQLLIRDIHTDYTPQQLEQIMSSNSISSAIKQIISKRRRLSTPQADEMTPTTAIEVRQRSHSEGLIVKTEKCEPLQDDVDISDGDSIPVEICERFNDKDVTGTTLTQTGVDEAFYSSKRKSSVFKYARSNKNENSVNGDGEDEDSGNVSSRDSQSKNSSPVSSPQLSSPRLSTGKGPQESPTTSRSGSTHELTSNASSLRDCSKFSLDCDRTHWDIDPAFIFRQLYPLENAPVGLPESEDVSRSLRNLDLILVVNTHKIGLIYVGPGQTNEVNILRNTYGSLRYVEFVKSLGDMVWLSKCDQKSVYVGGLDTNHGLDGDYTVSWRDKTSQVVFHVATLMPQNDTDPTSTNKKRHIGNNFVTIVYNDSGLPYKQGTIKGQCNISDIVIEPQSANMNIVTFNSVTKTKLADLKPHSAVLISDASLGLCVKQMAINANGLCQVLRGQGSKNAYWCNWLERLRVIHRICSRSGTPISSPTPGRRDAMY